MQAGRSARATARAKASAAPPPNPRADLSSRFGWRLSICFPLRSKFRERAVAPLPATQKSEGHRLCGVLRILVEHARPKTNPTNVNSYILYCSRGALIAHCLSHLFHPRVYELYDLMIWSLNESPHHIFYI